MSAAVNAFPANHLFLPSSASMKSRWRVRFGFMKVDFTLCEIALAMGFTKNGIGPSSIRSKTSFR